MFKQSSFQIFFSPLLQNIKNIENCAFLSYYAARDSTFVAMFLINYSILPSSVKPTLIE